MPEFVHLIAQRRNYPQATDNYSALSPVACHIKRNGAAPSRRVRAAPEIDCSHLLLLLILDIFDDITQALELFGLFVRDLMTKFLLQRHDQLDRVKRVGP